MKRKLAILFFLSLLMAIPTQAQTDTVAQKIIGIGKTDNQTMDHLDVLCNRIGGRPDGSSAYESATIRAAQKFREWGMEVILDEIGVLPVGFNRGPWSGRLLSDEGLALHFATPSYMAWTKGVQRGHVLIEPRTQAEFDRMKGKLKGALVLILGENDGHPIDISARADSIRDSIKQDNAKVEEENSRIRKENREYREKGITENLLLPLNEEPDLFYKEMHEAGILGIIQSAKTPIRVIYDRKNLMNMTFENLPTVPDIKLDEHQYKVIRQMVEERRYFLLEFDIRNHFRPGPIPYHNVIGVIPGTEFPDEYVIVGGHLDSYDVAIGGVDNGSGTTPSMEDFEMICAPLNDINPDFPFKIEERQPAEKPQKAWGADSGFFAVSGVPVLHFNTADPKGCNFNYDEIWHTERDTCDKSIKEYQEHVSIVTAIVVYGVANLNHLMNREGYWK